MATGKSIPMRKRQDDIGVSRKDSNRVEGDEVAKAYLKAILSN